MHSATCIRCERPSRAPQSMPLNPTPHGVLSRGVRAISSRTSSERKEVKAGAAREVSACDMACGIQHGTNIAPSAGSGWRPLPD